MDYQEEKRVKKQDFKKRWGRDKERGKRERSKESQYSDKNQGNETIHIDKKRGEGNEEERKDGKSS